MLKMTFEILPAGRTGQFSSLTRCNYQSGYSHHKSANGVWSRRGKNQCHKQHDQADEN